MLLHTLTLVLAGVALGACFRGERVSGNFMSRLGALARVLLRGAVLLAGFYLFAGLHVADLLACLAGFVLARIELGWITRLQALLRGPAPHGQA